MGCLFGTSRPQKYQMHEYDKFEILDQVKSVEEFYQIFRGNGIWNKLLLRVPMQQYIHMLQENEQNIFEGLTGISFEVLLSNLPKTKLHEILAPEEEFLNKSMLNREDLYKEEYSCFSDAEDIHDDAKSDSMESMNNALDGISIPVNHQSIIEDFIRYLSPDSKEKFQKAFIKYLYAYVRDVLQMSLFFQQTHSDKFFWDANLTQKSCITKAGLIYILNSEKSIQNNLRIDNVSQSTQKLNNSNKIPIQLNNAVFYLDTIDEANKLIQLNNKYSILAEQYKNLDLIVVKELGSKLTILKYPKKQLLQVIMLSSIENFKGVPYIYDQFVTNDEVCLLVEPINTTLDKLNLSVINTRLIMKQLLVIIDYFHFMGIIFGKLDESCIGVKIKDEQLDRIQIIQLPFAFYFMDGENRDHTIIEYYIQKFQIKELYGEQNKPIKQLINHKWFKEQPEFHLS